MTTDRPEPFAALRASLAAFDAPRRASAIARLREWVEEDHSERPTRSTLRAWAADTITELGHVQTRLTAAIARANQAERELAEERERDTVEIAGLRDCVRVRDAELDELRAALGMWEGEAARHAQEADRLRDQVETLLDKRNELVRERDKWEWIAHERAQGMRKQRAELDRLRTELAALKESNATRRQALLARMGVVRPGETCAHGSRVPDECELLDELLELVEDVDPARGGAG